MNDFFGYIFSIKLPNIITTAILNNVVSTMEDIFGSGSIVNLDYHNKDWFLVLTYLYGQDEDKGQIVENKVLIEYATLLKMCFDDDVPAPLDGEL